VQDRFQFTEDDAQALASVERTTEKRSIQGQENYQRSVKNRRQQQILRQHQEDVAKWKSEISSYRARIRSNESKISIAKNRARAYRKRGNKGLNYDSANKEVRKADQLRKSSNRLSALISSLERKISQPSPL